MTQDKRALAVEGVSNGMNTLITSVYLGTRQRSRNLTRRLVSS